MTTSQIPDEGALDRLTAQLGQAASQRGARGRLGNGGPVDRDSVVAEKVGRQGAPKIAPACRRTRRTTSPWTPKTVGPLQAWWCRDSRVRPEPWPRHRGYGLAVERVMTFWFVAVARRLFPSAEVYVARQLTMSSGTSVLSPVILYRDAPDFLWSARRDDEQWRAPREEEQRSRRQERQAYR